MKPRRSKGLFVESLERRDLLALWDGAVGDGGPDDGPTGALSVPMPTTFVGDVVVDTGAGDDRFSPHAVVDGTALIRMGAGDDRYEPPHHDTESGSMDGGLIAATKVIDLEPDESPQPGPSPQHAAESTPTTPDGAPLNPVQTVIGPFWESDVTVEVVSGTLFIRGGDEGDWVRVIQRGAGSFAVTSGRGGGFIVAIEGCGGNATVYEGVTAIDIEMGGGDDHVVLNGTMPLVSIDTADGDDLIRLGGSTSDFWNGCFVFGMPSPVAATIGGDLVIDAGAGNDVLYPHALVQGDADIRLGGGDDAIIEQYPIHGGGEGSAPLTVEGEEFIDFRADEGEPPQLPPPPHDVTAEVVDGTLYIRGGDQGDWVRIESRGSQSFAVIARRTRPGSPLLISLGGNEDATVYDNVTAIVVDLGAGDDNVQVLSGAPRLSIDTGDGDDVIRLGGMSSDFWPPGIILHSIPFPMAATIHGDLTIDMGAGNDQLRPNARVEGDTVIRMGSGDDEIIETTNSYFGETPAPLTTEGSQLIDFGADEGEPPPPPARPASTVAREGDPPTTIMSAKGRVPEVPTMAGTMIPAPLIGPITLTSLDLIEPHEPDEQLLTLEDILPYLVVPTHAREHLSPEWVELQDGGLDWPEET